MTMHRAATDQSTQHDVEAVVIGGSSGAFAALRRILPALQASLPVPIAIVVHLRSDRPSLIAEVVSRWGPLEAKEAEDKEPLAPGKIYFAPPGYHLLVERDRSFSLTNDEPVCFSRPSIDVLFESAADAFGVHLAAVVLSGANDDGAHGLACVARAGGRIAVQSPSDSDASAMPQAALASCPSAVVRSAAGLGDWIRELVVPQAPQSVSLATRGAPRG